MRKRERGEGGRTVTQSIDGASCPQHQPIAFQIGKYPHFYQREPANAELYLLYTTAKDIRTEISRIQGLMVGVVTYSQGLTQT